MYGISAIVLIGIIYGVVLIGTPASQHAINLDQQRVNDLSNIQNYLVYNVYGQKGALPEILKNDPILNFSIPLDPETKLPYAYRKTSSNNFELCAEFSASSTPDQSYRYPAYGSYGVDQNWEHPKGHYCFSRTIDTNPGVPVK